VSYDLAFWRQDESEARPPQTLYEAFLERRRVDGIPDLPDEEILSRVLAA
jgi:hypothetical protein